MKIFDDLVSNYADCLRVRLAYEKEKPFSTMGFYLGYRNGQSLPWKNNKNRFEFGKFCPDNVILLNDNDSNGMQQFVYCVQVARKSKFPYVYTIGLNEVIAFLALANNLYLDAYANEILSSLSKARKLAYLKAEKGLKNGLTSVRRDYLTEVFYIKTIKESAKTLILSAKNYNKSRNINASELLNNFKKNKHQTKDESSEENSKNV